MIFLSIFILIKPLQIYNFRDVISSTVVRESESRDKGQKDYAGLWAKYKTQVSPIISREFEGAGEAIINERKSIISNYTGWYINVRYK